MPVWSPDNGQSQVLLKKRLELVIKNGRCPYFPIQYIVIIHNIIHNMWIEKLIIIIILVSYLFDIFGRN
jgi:hypothetical protein